MHRIENYRRADIQQAIPGTRFGARMAIVYLI
jgi:hypothetical protein